VPARILCDGKWNSEDTTCFRQCIYWVSTSTLRSFQSTLLEFKEGVPCGLGMRVAKSLLPDLSCSKLIKRLDSSVLLLQPGTRNMWRACRAYGALVGSSCNSLVINLRSVVRIMPANNYILPSTILVRERLIICRSLSLDIMHCLCFKISIKKLLSFLD
jgi:hypothetical protein